MNAASTRTVPAQTEIRCPLLMRPQASLIRSLILDMKGGVAMVLLLILTVPDEALTPRSRTVLCNARAKMRKAVFPCPGGTKKRRKASFHGPLPAPRRCRAGQRKNDTRVSGSPQTFRRAAKTMNTQPGIPALRGKHGKPAPRLRRPSDGRKQTGQDAFRAAAGTQSPAPQTQGTCDPGKRLQLRRRCPQSCRLLRTQRSGLFRVRTKK